MLNIPIRPVATWPGKENDNPQLDGTQEFAFPKGAMTCFNVGKHVAGRLLDGREWNEMPEVNA